MSKVTLFYCLNATIHTLYARKDGTDHNTVKKAVIASTAVGPYYSTSHPLPFSVSEMSRREAEESIHIPTCSAVTYSAHMPDMRPQNRLEWTISM